MIANWSKRLLEKLKSKAYRAAYVAENVRTSIAYQVRTMRDQRDISQTALGQLMDKPQSVVSRLENPDYGKMTVQSLLDVAKALDVALLVQFVSFPDFIQRTRDVSPDALQVNSYNSQEMTAALENPFEQLDAYTNWYARTINTNWTTSVVSKLPSLTVANLGADMFYASEPTPLEEKFFTTTTNVVTPERTRLNTMIETRTIQ